MTGQMVIDRRVSAIFEFKFSIRGMSNIVADLCAPWHTKGHTHGSTQNNNQRNWTSYQLVNTMTIDLRLFPVTLSRTCHQRIKAYELPLIAYCDTMCVDLCEINLVVHYILFRTLVSPHENMWWLINGNEYFEYIHTAITNNVPNCVMPPFVEPSLRNIMSATHMSI